MLLTVPDLERLGSAALQEFTERLAPGACDVERPATRLEAKLEQLYGIAVSMAQQEEGLAGIAAIWGEMVGICDRMTKALAKTAKDPLVRSEAYDRILDIRNACEENRALHA